MTSWMMMSAEYLATLKDKGWGDESFYTEYNFICYERYISSPDEILEESYRLQAEIFLRGE